MASAIYILDDNYNAIVSRIYKYELDSGQLLHNFKREIGPNISNSKPIVHSDGIDYVFTVHEELVFVVVCLENIDAMLILQFLFRFIELLQNYLQISTLEKEVISSNYVLIYELFDEILDYGLPQSTDFSILREYIKLDKQDDDIINYLLSRTSTTKISWRPKGIFYKKNEIFIDLIEHVSLQYNLQTGEIKKNVILGEIDSKCYLSGMPVCKLGLNEVLNGQNEFQKTIFDNINFHQCVELSNLDKNVIQFMPPDGALRLVNYNIVNVSTTNLKPVIMVEPVYRLFSRRKGHHEEHKETPENAKEHKTDAEEHKTNANEHKTGLKYKLRISLDLKTFFKRKYLIKNLEVRIPLTFRQLQGGSPDGKPKLYINFNKLPKFKTKIGTVVLSLDRNLIIWKIPSINGNSASSIFTNISKNVIDELYQMMSEFELVPEEELIRMLDSNTYYDKVDNNSLYYSKLVDEKEILVRHDKNGLGAANGSNLISCHFEIPYLSYSGLKIDFLKIIEDQYNFQSFPWVRYLIKNDEYVFNLGERNFIDQIEYEN